MSLELQKNYKPMILVLLLIFAVAMTFDIRTTQMKFGFELNEFDPFFNLRATDFIVKNGYVEYRDWVDQYTWYPDGRDVASTSQAGLHLTASQTYKVFGSGLSLYDFVIIFPVVFGSLTCVVMFFFIRPMWGDKVAITASILLGLSIPILLRGGLGWFKSEPLGLFYGLLALALFLYGIKAKSIFDGVGLMILGGLTMAFALASWGGTMVFLIPIALFILLVPFMKNIKKGITIRTAIFAVMTLTILLGFFERPGVGFTLGFGGLLMILPVVILAASRVIAKGNTKKAGILLVAVLISGVILAVAFDLSTGLSSRYTSMLFPFMSTTDDPLVQSVAEHKPAQLQNIISHHKYLLFFAMMGGLAIYKARRTPYAIFGIITIGTMFYLGLSSVRMEVFISIALIMLSSLGIVWLINFIQMRKDIKKQYKPLLVFLMAGMVIFMMYSEGKAVMNYPMIILSGGTPYMNDEWIDALAWLQSETPEGSVVMAWWDYGYWITTVSERITLIDNATLNSTSIQKVATIFLDEPDVAIERLQDNNIDYVLAYIGGQQMSPEHFLLGGVGEPAKVGWIAKIGNRNSTDYVSNNGLLLKEDFHASFLGQMFPFELAGQGNFEMFGNQTMNVYFKQQNLPLVYDSNFTASDGRFMQIVIYKVP